MHGAGHTPHDSPLWRFSYTDLVVRNHDYALGKPQLDNPRTRGQDLACDRLITTNAHGRRAENMRH